MLSRFRRLPSPALVIASIALILAVGGGSFALAISDKKSDKKIARKVANKVVTKRAPGLSVNHANTANVAGTVREATQSPTSVDLVAGSGDQVIVSLNLPAGKYLITANGYLNNNSNFTERRLCNLTAGGNGFDQTFVGTDTNATDDDVTPFSLQGAGVLNSPTTVAVTCERPGVGGPLVSANNVRIDALSVAGVG